MTPIPDRDTCDALALYDLAITLVAKADFYSDKSFELVTDWLCNPDYHAPEDLRNTTALAHLLRNIRQELPHRAWRAAARRAKNLE